MELKLTLPVPVSINALYVNQFRYDPRTRTRKPTGARVLSNAGEKSKKLIQKAAKEQLIGQGWDYDWTIDKDNFMYMDAVIYFSRRGRDSDNVFKLLNDSLEKIAYDNDSRVLTRVQRVLYDDINPRIEITLSPVKYVGIFENIAEAEVFKKGCVTCSRYLNGRCSILVDSTRGTVRPEITINETSIICKKYNEKKK